MAVMKYKENGVWKELPATVNVDTGLFRYAFIERATLNAYDLSSFVTPGADFMLMFGAIESNAPNDTSTPIYIWINSEKKLRNVTGNTFTNQSNNLNPVTTNNLDDWMPVVPVPSIASNSDDYIPCFYDEETNSFNIDNSGVHYGAYFGKYALLFYA